MKIVLEDWQIPLYDELSKSTSSICLAAGTGCGKTVIASKLIQDSPNSTFLVLTHGTNVLKKNFVEQLKKYDIKHTTDIGSLGLTNVLVQLPQSVYRKLSTLPQYDYLVIDEAHEYFQTQGKMYQAIMDWHKGKVIALTASHFKMTMPKVFFSREECLEVERIVDAEMRLIAANVRFDSTDFNNDGELKTSTFVDDPTSFIIPHIRVGVPTLVAMHSVGMVDKVFNSLKDLGYSVTYETHKSKTNGLERLKAGEFQICVVQRMGILGFDYERLGTMIDCTFTQNVSRWDQMLGRVLRYSELYDKRFIKIVPRNDMIHYELLATAVLAIGNKEQYREWDGDQSRISIPMKRLAPKDEIINDDVIDIVDIDSEEVVYSVPTENGDDLTNTQIKRLLVQAGKIDLNGASTEKIPKPSRPVPDFVLRFGQYQAMLRDEITYKAATLQEGFDFIRFHDGRSIPNGFWNCYDNVKKVAIECGAKNLNEFHKLESGAYDAAWKKNWTLKLRQDMNWPIEKVGPWSLEDHMEKARGFTSVQEYKKNTPGAQRRLAKDKLTLELTKAMGWKVKRVIYTYEQLLELARPFSSLKEFGEKTKLDHQVRKSKWSERLCKELGWKYSDWSKFEDIAKIAETCSGPSDLSTKYPGVSRALHKKFKDRVGEIKYRSEAS